MHSFTINTGSGISIHDITDHVFEIAGAKRIDDGVCLIYAPHTTCALIINEFEPNLEQDFIAFFKAVIPQDAQWKHDAIDNNASAHLLSGMFGPSVAVPVRNGRLMIGSWQRVLLCEFDGPRTRHIISTIVSND